MKPLAVASVASLPGACATVIPASQGIQDGNIAYNRGDYARARDSFSSALQIATQQDWTSDIATAKYGLGRSLGQLCQFSEAERYLIEAAELENEVSAGKGVRLSQDYFELARLYYDYGKYEQAVPYFSKAVPLAEGLGVAATDPIGFADVLEDYAVALSKTGDTAAASGVESRISDLRRSNPGRSAGFRIIRFASQCVPGAVPGQDASLPARS